MEPSSVLVRSAGEGHWARLVLAFSVQRGAGRSGVSIAKLPIFEEGLQRGGGGGDSTSSPWLSIILELPSTTARAPDSSIPSSSSLQASRPFASEGLTLMPSGIVTETTLASALARPLSPCGTETSIVAPLGAPADALELCRATAGEKGAAPAELQPESGAAPAASALSLAAR